MEWGTRTAIDTYRKLHNRVPDVVYDLGAVGKEPMIRLLKLHLPWLVPTAAEPRGITTCIKSK